MNKLILLTGPKGVGKTTLADALMKEFELNGLTVHRLSFASTLKEMASVFFDALGIQVTNKDKEKLFTINPSGRKPISLTPRQVMQTLGTEWGRNCIHENIWTTIVQAQVLNTFNQSSNNVIIIDDCRYVNEVTSLTSVFEETVVIKLRRNKVAYTGEHPSEVELPDAIVDIELDLPDYLPASPAYRLLVLDLIKELDE